jgi:hypothetical protein
LITIPASSPIDGIAVHDLADDRIGEIAAGVDHHDIAGRSDIQRLVRHQIIAGARLHGERRTRKHTFAMIRPQPWPAAGQARHAIADIGDRQRSETCERIPD